VSVVQALLSLHCVSIVQQVGSGVTEQRLLTHLSIVHGLPSKQSLSVAQHPTLGV
jgi:hypothetical protein